MKLTAIILITACMAATAGGRAQQVTIIERSVPLEKVLHEIKKQTGYTFVYQRKIFDNSFPVTLHLKNVPLEKALQASFDNQPLTYKIFGKVIAVNIKIPEEPASGTGDRSTLKVENTPIEYTGKIVDKQGNPLAGATIRVKGTGIYSVADQHGWFSVQAKDEDVLVITFVGYQTREVPATKKTAMIIVLQPEESYMDTSEVVYSTGFQHVPKERATGSFVHIDKRTLNRTISTNLLDRLYYVANGLSKMNLQGSGNRSDINIRGLSTVFANQKPLIVVDGFPYEEDHSNVSWDIMLNRLNPNDIESVTILKDAAAASIWGARSGNGVIVITTRSGKYNQRTNVQLTTNLSLVEKPRMSKANLMSSGDMIEYERTVFNSGIYNDYDDVYPALGVFPTLSPVIELLLAQRRGEITAAETNARLDKLSNHDVRNDLKKYLLQTGINQQYNFNVSGGTEKMTYIASFGFDKNQDVNIGNDQNRVTIHFKNSYRLLKNLELNGFLYYTQSKEQYTDLNAMNTYLANGHYAGAAPYLQLVDEQGKRIHVPNSGKGTLRTPYIDTVRTPGLLDWHFNPIDEIANNDRNNKTTYIRAGGGLKYNFMKGFDFLFNGQYERSIISGSDLDGIRGFNARNMINRYMYLNSEGNPRYPVPVGGILNLSERNLTAYQLRGQLNVNRTYGNHQFSALAAMDISQRENQFYSYRILGYDPNTLALSPTVDFINAFTIRPEGYTTRIPDPRSIGGNLTRMISYSANLGYTFNNRYTLTGSARSDGSNYFGIKANQRFRPQWSAGAAWQISKEQFFPSGKISLLNLRVSYGYNGNLDNTIPTMPVIRYSPSTGNDGQYNNNQPWVIVTQGNPSLTWERVAISNIALDFSIFRNRLTGSVEYYSKNTTDMIGPMPLDPSSGNDAATGNTGSLRTRGIDFRLNAIIAAKSVKVISSFNASYNREKVTGLNVHTSILKAVSNYLGGSVLPGGPVSTIFSYRWGGLDAENGNPQGIVKGKTVPFREALGNNANGEPNTSPADLIYHGSTRPAVFGNLLNTISWKGFSASFNIVYNLGFHFRISSVDYNTLSGGWSAHGDYAKRWQKPGDERITNVPSFGQDTRYRFYSKSEVLVRKGDFIFLQDINLAYDIGRIKKIPFRQAQIFINCRNIGTIWTANKEGINPFIPINNSNIPVPREFAMGITINY